MTINEQARFDDLYQRHLTALKLQGSAGGDEGRAKGLRDQPPAVDPLATPQLRHPSAGGRGRLREIQTLLGHASPLTTVRYTQLTAVTSANTRTCLVQMRRQSR